MSHNRIKLESLPNEFKLRAKHLTLHHRVAVINNEGMQLMAFVKRREAAHDTIQLEDTASCNLATATKEVVEHGISYSIVAMAPTNQYCIDDTGNEFIIKENNNNVLKLPYQEDIKKDIIKFDAGKIQKSSGEWIIAATQSINVPSWVLAFVAAIICIEK